MTRIPQEQALARVKKLVELAAHKDTPKNEAAQAAVTACKYIRKYKLLDGPAGHPAVQTLKNVVDTINDPDIQAAAGVVTQAVGMAASAFRKRRRR